MATPTNASAIAAASAAKAAATAAANQAKAAATTAAANARSAAIAPSVQNVIGNINTGIGALSSLVNTKAPTAAQQAALTASQVAQQAAIAAQTPIVESATTGYNTAINTANTNYSNAIASANAISVPEPIYDTGSTGSTGPMVTDYISAAQQQLMNWGILNANDPNSTDLMNQITTLAQQGAQPDTIALTIQNSSAYKARFSGNDARVAAGFSAYSPADYMTAENNYRSILSEQGVPDKYQTQSFLASLIGKNVGTATLQNYVNMASQLATTQDPYMLQTAYQQYGLTQGDLIAHFLDPNTAVPVLQQQFAGTQVAAEAARQNLALSQQNAMSLAAQGVTQQQAQAGFTNIGSQLAQQQQIAVSLGGNAANVGSELTAAQFNANVNGVSAAQAQQDLARQKAGLVNLYSGSSGAGKGSLYSEQSGVQ
jgi:hypothetical protein